MTLTTSDIIPRMETLSTNPAAIARLALKAMEYVAIDNESIIVDANHPVVGAIETATMVSVAAMNVAKTYSRRQYPTLAQTYEDLYYHLSGKDLIDRFATPASTHVRLLYPLDVIRRDAVDTGDGSGTRLIIIPRFTEITVAGYALTMQYPIVIRVRDWGGLDIFYDLTKPSPLQTIETNRVDWTLVVYNQRQYIQIDIPILQMAIQRQTASMNATTGFAETYTFTDKFLYCRAYIKSNDAANWTEIETTHNEMVHDATTPTVSIKVLNQSIAVSVPDIYFTNGLITDNLRLDIYTTKGALDVYLRPYSSDNYQAVWSDPDDVYNQKYSKPLVTSDGLMMLSLEYLTGGANGLSFTELRDRALAYRLRPLQPITEKQLPNYLSDNGFTLNKMIDNITDRRYIASRDIPPPSNGETVTGMGSTIYAFQSTMEALSLLSSVSLNNGRLTIKPTTLYRKVDGVMKVVGDDEIATLLDPTQTTQESLANAINNNLFYYSPYHYVWDATNYLFETRPYRLDAPTVMGRYFLQENTGLLINVSTKSASMSVNSTGAGFIFAIEIGTSAAFAALDLDQIYLQLSFIPPNSNQRVYLNGVLLTAIDPSTQKPVDGRYIYAFYLNTDYDIDSNHRLILSDSSAAMDLTTEFDLVYVVKNHLPPDSTTSDIDTIIKPSLFVGYDPTAIYRGLVNERITLKFGDYLEHLWTRSRVIEGTATYATYQEDILAIYDEDVYLRDSEGNVALTYDETTQTFTATLIHHKGDQIYDSTGAVVYKHRKGEYRLGPDGKPVVDDTRRLTLREADMFFLDGGYYFATAAETLTYRNDTVSLITQWITDEIPTLNGALLDNTELLYYPKTTIGYVDVYTEDNVARSVRADQSLSVVYYMRSDKLANANLKASIVKKTATVLNDALAHTTITPSSLENALITAFAGDVIAASVKGFLNDLYTVVTVRNPTTRFIIGKQAVSRSDKAIVINDAVSVEFKEHKV